MRTLGKFGSLKRLCIDHLIFQTNIHGELLNHQLTQKHYELDEHGEILALKRCSFFCLYLSLNYRVKVMGLRSQTNGHSGHWQSGHVLLRTIDIGKCDQISRLLNECLSLLNLIEWKGKIFCLRNEHRDIDYFHHNSKVTFYFCTIAADQ